MDLQQRVKNKTIIKLVVLFLGLFETINEKQIRVVICNKRVYNTLMYMRVVLNLKSLKTLLQLVVGSRCGGGSSGLVARHVLLFDASLLSVSIR